MTVSLSLDNVQPGKSNDDVKILQLALADKIAKMIGTDGIFGKNTEEAYALYQRFLGYTGDDASGSPGTESLTALGREYGFVPGAVAAPTGAIDPKAVTFNRYTGGGTLSQWISAACEAAGVPANSAWITGYKTLCTRESAGDPHAVNLWDSNAVTPPGYSSVADYGNNGTFGSSLAGKSTPFQCSRGVAQCIPQTFAKFHAKGTSNNIYDPVANIAASIKYVRATYNVSADGSDLTKKVQQADPNRSPKGY